MKKLMLLMLLSVVLVTIPVNLCALANTREIIIDEELARSLRLKVGDTVLLSPFPSESQDTSFRVIGIAKKNSLFAENTKGYKVYMYLGDLQEILDMPDQVSQFQLKVNDVKQVPVLVNKINDLNFGVKAYSANDYDRQLGQINSTVIAFYSSIGLITLLVSSFFLACTMIISVSRRRKEVAILRAIGFSKGTIFKKFLFETTKLTMVGTVIGCLCGLAGVLIINSILKQVYAINYSFFVVSLKSIAITMMVSMILGPVAGLYPAWKASRINIIKALRD